MKHTQEYHHGHSAVTKKSWLQGEEAHAEWHDLKENLLAADKRWEENLESQFQRVRGRIVLSSPSVGQLHWEPKFLCHLMSLGSQMNHKDKENGIHDSPTNPSRWWWRHIVWLFTSLWNLSARVQISTLLTRSSVNLSWLLFSLCQTSSSADLKTETRDSLWFHTRFGQD